MILINRKLKFTLILGVMLFSFFMTISALSAQLSAQSATDLSCLPSSCRRAGQYEPDFACQLEKLNNPASNCCQNKCKDGFTPTELPAEQKELFQFFGNKVIITEGNRIPALINLLVSTVLGFMSLYALFQGIYLGAVKRPKATSEEDVAKINKTLQSLILGFILAWSFIFIIQFVANLLGLGDLSTMQLVGEDGGTIITIN